MNTVTSERAPTLEAAYLWPQSQEDSSARLAKWYLMTLVEFESADTRAGRSLTATARHTPPKSAEPRVPTSDLGRRLRQLRAQIVASGAPLLDWQELEYEVAERRGER